MTDETQPTPEESDGTQTIPGESGGFSQGTRRVPDIEVPEEHAEAIPFLLEKLAEERATSEARLDDLQRVAAEFENFRKRTERERDEIRHRASQRLVEALLPVLDSFDGAFAHDPQTPGEELLRKGVTGTFHQLMEILEREGLEPIDAPGAPFDPEVHEAVSGAAGDDLKVAAELRRGYRLKGRVLRPAMVAVVSADDTEEAGKE